MRAILAAVVVAASVGLAAAAENGGAAPNEVGDDDDDTTWCFCFGFDKRVTKKLAGSLTTSFDLRNWYSRPFKADYLLCESDQMRRAFASLFPAHGIKTASDFGTRCRRVDSKKEGLGSIADAMDSLQRVGAAVDIVEFAPQP